MNKNKRSKKKIGNQLDMRNRDEVSKKQNSKDERKNNQIDIEKNKTNCKNIYIYIYAHTNITTSTLRQHTLVCVGFLHPNLYAYRAYPQ